MAKKKAAKKTAKKPIKVAVLGLGRSGWNIHVARLRKDKRYIITAVSDPMAERREQAEKELGCESYSTIPALLKSADAELVVNATPTKFHVDTTLAIIKSGRDVLLEKPVATSHADGRKMANAAKRAGKRLFFHHNQRLAPDARHLRDIAESGLIGRIFEVKVRMQFFKRRYDWQTLRRHAGGMLGNQGTHYIDAAMYVVGDKVKDVLSTRQLVSDAGDAEDHVKSMIVTKNGTVIDVELSSSCNVPESKWTILGTRGTLTCDGEITEVSYFNAKDVKPLVVDTKPIQSRQYIREDLPWKKKTMKAVGKEKRDFYDNVFEVCREKAEMFITPDSVLEVLKVMDKIADAKIQNIRDF